MNIDPIKDFIERAKSAVKRASGKLSGEKASATRTKVLESDGKVQAGSGELKEGIKKTV